MDTAPVVCLVIVLVACLDTAPVVCLVTVPVSSAPVVCLVTVPVSCVDTSPVVCLVTVPVSCLDTAAVQGGGNPPPGPPPSSTPPGAGSQIYLRIFNKKQEHKQKHKHKKQTNGNHIIRSAAGYAKRQPVSAEIQPRQEDKVKKRMPHTAKERRRREKGKQLSNEIKE